MTSKLNVALGWSLCYGVRSQTKVRYLILMLIYRGMSHCKLSIVKYELNDQGAVLDISRTFVLKGDQRKLFAYGSQSRS